MPPPLSVEKGARPLKKDERHQGPAEARELAPKGQRSDMIDEKTQERRPHSECEQMEKFHAACTIGPFIPLLASSPSLFRNRVIGL